MTKFSDEERATIVAEARLVDHGGRLLLLRFGFGTPFGERINGVAN